MAHTANKRVLLLPSEETLDGAAGCVGGSDLGAVKAMDSKGIEGLEDGSEAQYRVLTITF
jgi:hypothetical protein